MYQSEVSEEKRNKYEELNEQTSKKLKDAAPTYDEDAWANILKVEQVMQTQEILCQPIIKRTAECFLEEAKKRREKATHHYMEEQKTNGGQMWQVLNRSCYLQNCVK